MSIGNDSLSSSQLLSSSHHSINSSKKASSEISKIYKHASQLYLTRQLAEAYEVLQPVIRPLSRPDHAPSHTDDPALLAPIAVAGTSQRIKIWSLYVSLLNAIVELEPEEGKQDFGSKEYNVIVRIVQSGDLWEQVVRDGYQGRESSVDAEVVYNLSNLLLAQAPDQIVNQSRLETYLSSAPGVGLDLSTHLEQRLGGQSYGHRPHLSGAATPKDLSSRIKLLELFTLHVLPRNTEWDYAKSFINNSDVLDDERREAFLQTLQELQDANERPTFTDTEDEFGQDYVERASTHQDEQSHHTSEYAVNGTSTYTSEAASSVHRRTSSEVDYGIDSDRPNGIVEPSNPSQTANPAITPLTTLSPAPVNDGATRSDAAQPSPSTKAPKPSRSSANAPPQPSSSALRRQTRKSPKAPSKPKSIPPSKSSNSVIRQAQHLLNLLTSIPANLSRSLVGNPTAMLRMLFFMIAFLVMLSRKNTRQRLRAIIERSWTKVKGTVGMGVKVSYV